MHLKGKANYNVFVVGAISDMAGIGDKRNPRSDVIGWSRGYIGWQKIERDCCLLLNLANIFDL